MEHKPAEKRKVLAAQIGSPLILAIHGETTKDCTTIRNT